MAKRDALTDRHCGTCAMFHNPNGGPTGYCVAHPATVFIVGMAPAGGALVQPDKPQQLRPIVQSFVPVVSEDDGCFEHVPAIKH